MRVKNILSVGFLLSTMLALVACSSQLPQMQQTLANKPVTQRNYVHLDYSSLTRNTFAINASSSAYDFKTGKSYYKAFTLPHSSKAYTLWIDSYMIGQLPPRVYIFYPQVLLLDSQHRLIKTVTKPVVWRSRAFKTAYLGLKVPVSPQTKYLVIYTKAKVIGKYMPFTAVGGSVNGGMSIPLAPMGRLRLMTH